VWVDFHRIINFVVLLDKKEHQMNSTEIFTMALGLSSPWYVEQVEFKSSESEKYQELHIYLNFERGSKFTSSFGERVGAYNTIEKTW